MDGGHAQQPPPDGATYGGGEVARLLAEAEARAAADDQTLGEHAFLTDLLAHLDGAIEDAQQIRWPALGPEQMRAMIRRLHCARARLDAAVLAAVRAVDERDDIVPKARPGTAATTFLHRGVGLDRGQASLDADAAHLLDPDHGDLARVGVAYAAGQITRGHVDICVRAHRRLNADVRNALIPVVDPASGQETLLRCIDVVDATLVAQARAFTVPEFRRIVDRLVEHLDPPTPADAHRRRYLHLSQLPDGSLIGKFACGPAQALVLASVIAAGAAPQPGVGVDEHGVEHQLPDERTPAQRRMDALVEAVQTGCTATATGGTNAGDDPATGQQEPESTTEPTEPTEPTESTECPEPAEPTDRAERAEPGGPRRAEPGGSGEPGEPGEPAEVSEPQPEGECQIRRPPGVRAGAYPPVEIVVAATLDQLTAAVAGQTAPGAAHDPPRLWPADAPPGSPSRGSPPPASRSGPRAHPGFARAQHGGPVHPTTLALLACSGRLRRVLLDASGAVLDLGRTVRYASPAQRRALLARDGGCVIPGCLVAAEHCDAHHPTAWADDGPTDIANLALLCARHHTEVHDGGGWQIEMIHGVPWVRPPLWVHPTRPLLRNTAHRPGAGAA